ncbi:MAG: DNA-processing protein DprA [Kofleriaceae bacterium]
MTTVLLPAAQFPSRLQALGWHKSIYLRGPVPADGPAVAIVGSRAASGTGMNHAHQLARHLTARGIHVVSGGAVGIDGASHRGALAAGGTTTVVLGHGLDLAYPSRHAPMFGEVLAAGGSLVSLVADGTPPLAALFPQRNQLIAALADVVIVVEADLRSGSLSTAHAARKFGRVVAAWPGTPGCGRLLATGAAIVESCADAERAVLGVPRLPEPVVLDPITQQVKDAIAAGAGSVEAIVKRTGLTVRAVLRALPLLERCS